MSVQERLIREFSELAVDVGFQEFRGKKPIPSKKSAQSRIDDVLKRVIRQTKTDPQEVNLDAMHWEFVEGGESSLTHKGATTTFNIPPNIFLVGNADRGDGLWSTFFVKFVSHPFHQHGRRVNFVVSMDRTSA